MGRAQGLGRWWYLQPRTPIPTLVLGWQLTQCLQSPLWPELLLVPTAPVGTPTSHSSERWSIQQNWSSPPFVVLDGDLCHSWVSWGIWELRARGCFVHSGPFPCTNVLQGLVCRGWQDPFLATSKYTDQTQRFFKGKELKKNKSQQASCKWACLLNTISLKHQHSTGLCNVINQLKQQEFNWRNSNFFWAPLEVNWWKDFELINTTGGFGCFLSDENLYSLCCKIFI